jgi:hypothetical protein
MGALFKRGGRCSVYTDWAFPFVGISCFLGRRAYEAMLIRLLNAFIGMLAMDGNVLHGFLGMG